VDTADSGTIETATNANVIYVEQEPDWGDVFVYEALFEGDSAEAKATRRYFAALDPEKADNMDADEFSDATDAVEAANAWDYQVGRRTNACIGEGLRSMKDNRECEIVHIFAAIEEGNESCMFTLPVYMPFFVVVEASKTIPMLVYLSCL
jgi:ATPase subunit of ABC transporter with duplicated ATPase domains